MKQYTIQCGYFQGRGNTVVVEAKSVEQACALAIEQANDDSAGWDDYDSVGETYIDGIVEGEHGSVWDEKTQPLPIPPRYTDEQTIASAVVLPHYNAVIRIAQGKLYYGPLDKDSDSDSLDPQEGWVEVLPRQVSIDGADMLDKRELATVLAALRYWQRLGLEEECPEQDIAADCGSIDPLLGHEIDALCERLNSGERFAGGTA